MKILLSVLFISTSFALSGCGASQAEPAQTKAPTPAAIYKAGNGLQLAAGARELIGLKTIDVTEREIATSGRHAAIPAAALVRTVKGDFVYVANGPWLLRTPVTVGANDAAWFHVSDGLYEGDNVVAVGARALWLAELQAVNGGVGCADDK
jgi:hypothetical protein